MSFDFITTNFFPNKTPSQINNGECWKWALCASLQPGVTLWASKAHVFVARDGLFFDAECTIGVPDWNELPFYLSSPSFDEPTPHTLERFFRCERGAEFRAFYESLSI